MEDLNSLAADCIVVSCCCQCLVLQIIILVFLRLPCKLVRKTREIAKRRFQSAKRKWKKTKDYGISREGSLGILNDRFSSISLHSCDGCRMEEVDRVLEELSDKGLFGFGSFWGGDGSGNLGMPNDQQEFDYSLVQLHLIEMYEIGCFSPLCHSHLLPDVHLNAFGQIQRNSLSD